MELVLLSRQLLRREVYEVYLLDLLCWCWIFCTKMFRAFHVYRLKRNLNSYRYMSETKFFSPELWGVGILLDVDIILGVFDKCTVLIIVPLWLY